MLVLECLLVGFALSETYEPYEQWTTVLCALLFVTVPCMLVRDNCALLCLCTSVTTSCTRVYWEVFAACETLLRGFLLQ